MLAGLRHRAVSSSDNQDCAVHLSSTGNHVLDVVGVARGIDVSVVALLRLVLNVGNVDGNATFLLFRCLIDGIVSERLVQVRVLVSQNLGDSGGSGGLTVVNVTNGTDVDVRLRTLELRLCHF